LISRHAHIASFARGIRGRPWQAGGAGAFSDPAPDRRAGEDAATQDLSCANALWARYENFPADNAKREADRAELIARIHAENTSAATARD
jgi:hypothetical protein